MKNNGFVSKALNSKAGKMLQTAALATGIGATSTGCTIEVGPPEPFIVVNAPSCGTELVESFAETHLYERGCFAGTDAYGYDMYQYSCVTADTWLYDSCTGEDILQSNGRDVSVTWDDECFINHYTDDTCTPGLDY